MMNIDKRLLSVLATVGVCGFGLAACGESDLVELHEQELIAARNAPQAPPGSAPANPTNGGGTSGSGDSGSGGSDSGSTGDTTTDSQSPATPIDLSRYDLVFSDEFRGATLDPVKWNSAAAWGPDLVLFEQLQYYVDIQGNPDFGYNPFSFDGETLTISAIETPEELRAAANEQPWLSGILTTANQFDLTYGYIEARVDVQPGLGVWPAFWMLSSNYEALKPELFIMEYDGAKPDSFFHNYLYTDTEGNLRSPGQLEIVQPGLSDGFHTVGVYWSPGEIMYYIDGQPQYRIFGENVSSQAMYMILNLAIGGNWPGAPDATTERPATLVVDYVRAYQLR
jgi:beta-glucanase (GH16 family)